MNSDTSMKALFELHADDLLAISYSYVKDWQIAEDIVQDTFLTFWSKQAFRGESSIKTYLTRIAINRSKDYLKSWRYKSHLLTNDFWAFVKPSSRLEEQEVTASIGKAVLNLKVELREVVILYFYKDFTYKEIAELLQVSETAIRKRMNKAKDALKVTFEAEQWEVLFHE